MECVVKVSLTALVEILDAYERRPIVNSRVIGTLLGYNDSQNIQITNSFAVPHTETNDEVYMSIEFNQSQVALNQRANSNEKPVGWYSTGSEITGHSKLVHEDYYQKLCKKQCIFLLLDTSMQTSEIPIKAYISRTIGIPDKSSGVMFVPVPVEIELRDPETYSLRLMSEGLNNKRRTVFLKDDLTNVIDVSKNVLEMLKVVLKYVKDVLNNKITPDPRIGRKLAQIVLAIPKIDAEKLDGLISASTKDLLMYTFLCSITKTELKITEKMLKHGY